MKIVSFSQFVNYGNSAVSVKGKVLSNIQHMKEPVFLKK